MIILLSKLPSKPSSEFPLVTVWMTELSFVHVTVSPIPTVTSVGKKQEPDSAQLGSAASFGILTPISANTFWDVAMNSIAIITNRGSATQMVNLLHGEHVVHDFFMNKKYKELHISIFPDYCQIMTKSFLKFNLVRIWNIS